MSVRGGRPKKLGITSTVVRLPIPLYKRVRRLALSRGLDYGEAVQLLVEKATGPDPLTQMMQVRALIGRHRLDLQRALEREGGNPSAVDRAIEALTQVERRWGATVTAIGSPAAAELRTVLERHRGELEEARRAAGEAVDVLGEVERAWAAECLDLIEWAGRSTAAAASGQSGAGGSVKTRRPGVGSPGPLKTQVTVPNPAKGRVSPKATPRLQKRREMARAT